MAYTDFFRALVLLQTELWYHVDRVVRSRLSIDLAQLEALAILGSFEGAARVQDLANVTGITPGSASKYVDRLESKGLVARRSNPADRRSSVLDVTTEGRRVLDEFTPLLESILEERLGADLSESTGADLTSTLLGLKRPR